MGHYRKTMNNKSNTMVQKFPSFKKLRTRFWEHVLRNRPHELSSSMPPLRKWPMPQWCIVAGWKLLKLQNSVVQVSSNRHNKCVHTNKTHGFRTYSIYLNINITQDYYQSHECWSNPSENDRKRPFKGFWACHCYNHGLPFASAHLHVSLVNPWKSQGCFPKKLPSSMEKQCNTILTFRTGDISQASWRYEACHIAQPVPRLPVQSMPWFGLLDLVPNRGGAPSGLAAWLLTPKKLTINNKIRPKRIKKKLQKDFQSYSMDIYIYT